MLPRNPRRTLAAIAVLIAVVAGACGRDLPTTDQRASVDPELLDPTETDEERPSGYRESLERDAIPPVYQPTFVSPASIDWPGNELIIGVDLEGEQRAYPVSFLTFSEIVVDMHQGIPTLVTW